jgi:hypothetical protein
MPAPACLLRRSGRNRLDAVAVRRLRRILAFADGSAFSSLFELTMRAARIAPSSGGASAARSQRRCSQRGDFLPALTRDASALRAQRRHVRATAPCGQAARLHENRSAGAPNGGGPDSPELPDHDGIQPIPARSTEGVCRRRHRKHDRRRSGFPAVRPRRRGPDMPPLHQRHAVAARRISSSGHVGQARQTHSGSSSVCRSDLVSQPADFRRLKYEG